MDLGLFLLIFFMILFPCIIGAGVVIIMVHNLAIKLAKEKNFSYRRGLFEVVGTITHVLIFPFTALAVFFPFTRIIFYTYCSPGRKIVGQEF